MIGMICRQIWKCASQSGAKIKVAKLPFSVCGRRYMKRLESFPTFLGGPNVAESEYLQRMAEILLVLCTEGLTCAGLLCTSHKYIEAVVTSVQGSNGSASFLTVLKEINMPRSWNFLRISKHFMRDAWAIGLKCQFIIAFARTILRKCSRASYGCYQLFPYVPRIFNITASLSLAKIDIR